MFRPLAKSLLQISGTEPAQLMTAHNLKLLTAQPWDSQHRWWLQLAILILVGGLYGFRHEIDGGFDYNAKANANEAPVKVTQNSPWDSLNYGLQLAT